jgi:uncharacterized membrane protein
MSIEPILQAPVAVRLHLAAVMPMVLIGTWLIFASRKGARPHRVMGYVYVALVLIAAVDALFVQVVAPRNFLGLSFLHLAIPADIAALAGAVWAAWRGHVRLHRLLMQGLYAAILFTGALTVLPGRILYQALFGG